VFDIVCLFVCYPELIGSIIFDHLLNTLLWLWLLLSLLLLFTSGSSRYS